MASGRAGTTRRDERAAVAAEPKGTGMRIRWTTRIATAAGILTLLAGIATGGGGAAHAAARPAAGPAVVAVVGR
jgi:hypothetical protein